jgi:Ni,Fe-hydrogenase maturation factor
MARTQKDLPPRIVLYGIEGGNFEAGTALSPEVERAADKVIASLLAYVEDAYAEEEQTG